MTKDHRRRQVRHVTDAAATAHEKDRSTERADRPRLGRWWPLVAPLALASGYAVVAAVAGRRVFDTGQPLPGALLAAVLLGTFLLVCVGAGLRLFDDAAALARAEAAWQPNPWAYVGGATAALTAGRALQVWTGAIRPADPVLYLGGWAVVSLALSPVLAGPAYLLVRWRTVGLPDSTE